MKEFYQMDNVGRCKYSVNYHDGVQTHKDGSKFFGVAVFKNKKNLGAFIKKLKGDGYRETR